MNSNDEKQWEEIKKSSKLCDQLADSLAIIVGRLEDGINHEIIGDLRECDGKLMQLRVSWSAVTKDSEYGYKIAESR